MTKDVGGDVDWLSLQSMIAPTDKKGLVKYESWLESFKVGLGANEMGHELVHALYGNHRKLVEVFRLFDKDHNGVVDKEEWMEKCEWINAHLPEAKRINGDDVFRIMDLDHTGSINLNELFEGFRISQVIHSHAKPVAKTWQPVKAKMKLVMTKGAGRDEGLSLEAAPRTT